MLWIAIWATSIRVTRTSGRPAASVFARPQVYRIRLAATIDYDPEDSTWLGSSMSIVAYVARERGLMNGLVCATMIARTAARDISVP